MMMRYNNHLQDGLQKSLETRDRTAAEGEIDFSWLLLQRETQAKPFSLEEHRKICQKVDEQGGSLVVVFE